MEPKTPHDRYHLVLLSLWVVGVGTLFPWNAFISAPDYFSNFHDYVDPGANLTRAESRSWDNILTYFTTAFSVCNIVGQAVVLRKGLEWSISSRVELSILAMFGVMLIAPILSYTSVAAQTAFYLLVASAGLNGFCTAFFQSTIFGLGAMFPEIFTQAVMVGNSSAGLAVSLLRVVTKAAGGSQKASGALYMYLAAGWLLFSLVCFLFLRRLRFAQKHVDEFTSFERFHLDGESVTTAGPAAHPHIANQYTVVSQTHYHSEGTIEDIERDIQEASLKTVCGAPATAAEERAALLPAPAVEPKEEQISADGEPLGVMVVFRKIFPMAFAVWLTLFVSIAVFPGVVSRIPSPLGDGWFTTWMILLYNFGDNLGRILPQWVKPSRNVVLVMSILRIAFVPAFILCVSVITEPVWPILFMAGMSITNGWLASLCMMYGPEVRGFSQEERGTAGNIMCFSLLLGITFGSFTGLLVCNYLPDDGSDSSSTGMEEFFF
eukprot:TRINITY_DN18247_c1_g4_i1.p1 TRINITY_DN18247_c1_g4~~TRINITY_DN18247_c1_g4_i1.p1  ORF type:complete len:491 (+),score=201.55 TRINITY_DN18247_c1_g4_i1:129-1601(+)